MNASSGIFEALAGVVGGANLLQDTGDLAGYATDGRGVSGRPLAVVRPGSTAEVAALARIAATGGVRLVPQGARTGLVAAGIAGSGEDMLIVNLDRLAREPEIDALNRTARADAGVRLSRLNEAADAHGLFFPIDLGADPSVGGMIAANTGGARFLRYGDVRRNLLGIEMVTAEAEPRVLRLGNGLWKDNSALDLKQLLVGSAGSLGIVTAATLALSPRPAASVSAMLSLPRAETAMDLLRPLETAFSALLTAFEGISGAALTAALEHVPRLRDPFPHGIPRYAVLIEISAGGVFAIDELEERLGTVLMPWIERGDLADAAIDRGTALWAIRHAVPEGLRAAGRVVACDLSLRRGDVMRYRTELAAELERIAPQMRLCDFGHVGDGGMHFNLVWPASSGPFDAAVAERARRAIFVAAVERYQGSFSAEHGIGPGNAAWYEEFVAEDTRRLSGAIQRLVAPVPIGRVDFGMPAEDNRAR